MQLQFPCLLLPEFGKILVWKLAFALFTFCYFTRALSLHIMFLLMKLYHDISKIFITKGLIPASTVSFLPEDYILPLSLEDWLKSDETLKDIHPLQD